MVERNGFELPVPLVLLSNRGFSGSFVFSSAPTGAHEKAERTGSGLLSLEQAEPAVRIHSAPPNSPPSQHSLPVQMQFLLARSLRPVILFGLTACSDLTANAVSSLRSAEIIRLAVGDRGGFGLQRAVATKLRLRTFSCHCSACGRT